MVICELIDTYTTTSKVMCVRSYYEREVGRRVT